MDVLTNKQYNNYDTLNRYQNVPIYYHTLDNNYVCGTTTRISLDSPYKLYTVLDGDTLDSISLKFYGSPSYYWVIADFNLITDCFADLKIGATIAVPTLSQLNFE